MFAITINLYQMFGVTKLRYRESAEEVVESLPETLESPLTIDFAKIDFASHSFLHELLYGLRNRSVSFENTNESVQGLIDIIYRKRRLKNDS